LRLRLADLGLFPEQVVVKKGAQFWRGPVLVRLPGGAELALGQRLAAQVAVREEELPPPAACPAPLISASAAS
jgi:Fe2+ transport system protein FeoA